MILKIYIYSVIPLLNKNKYFFWFFYILSAKLGAGNTMVGPTIQLMLYSLHSIEEIRTEHSYLCINCLEQSGHGNFLCLDFPRLSILVLLSSYSSCLTLRVLARKGGKERAF